MARPLHLDFLPRPRWSVWTQRIVFAGGCVLAALAVAHELELQREAKDLKARVLAAEQATTGSAQSRRAASTAGSADSRREAIALELNLPWGRVFEVVERMASPKVAVLVLQPDAKAGSVKLVADAATHGDMLDYVKALSVDGRVVRVRLVNHEVQTSVPGRPVRFTVLATLSAE